MTLDRAIEHCQEKGSQGGPCAEEHRQLAAWLIELKESRQDRFIGYRTLVTFPNHLPIYDDYLGALAYISAVPESILCTIEDPSEAFEKMAHAITELSIPEEPVPDFSVSYSDCLKGHQRQSKRRVYAHNKKGRS